MQRRKSFHRQIKRKGKYKLPTCASPIVSVIIPVKNERKTIGRVLRQLGRLHRHIEVIVVANGSKDGTMRIAKQMGARVIAFPEALGHDVGRAIGAAAASGQVILFTDGDIVIPARDYRPLIQAVLGGADVALNAYNGPTSRRHVHNVILAKYALNGMLLQPELKGASLTTIPHALSRKALEVIGTDNLAVPPLAYVIACQSGLKVKAVHLVPVGKKNPRRRRRGSAGDPVEGLIIGDHLEAVNWLMSLTNARGSRTDLTRIRSMVR